MVMISGYYSDLYAQTLEGWRTVQYTSQTRSGRTAIEWVWLNFPPPLELHDYRYLGRDFRERERIKRKIKRWKSRLSKMPDLERHAMLAAIAAIAENNDAHRSATPETAIADRNYNLVASSLLALQDLHK
jgi:hypothetical protein